MAGWVLRNLVKIGSASPQEKGIDTSALVPRFACVSPNFLLKSSDKLGKVISINILNPTAVLNRSGKIAVRLSSIGGKRSCFD